MKKRPTGTGCLYRRGPIWWTKYHRNGKPYAESSHSPERQDAERLLKRRLGEIATGRFQGLAPERITIGELCDLVIEDYRRTGKRSLREVEWRADLHIRPALGATKAADFGGLHLKRYIAARREKGAADATINRELAIVRRGFSLALQNDPLLVLRTPHIPKLAEHNVREGFIEHGEYVKLRDALPRHLKALFVVGYHTGARVGELRKINRHEQVDLVAGEIRLQGAQTKNGRPRTLPVYGEMRHWLEMQVQEIEQNFPACPQLFHYQGRPIGGHLKGWQKACGAAGLPGLLFHDLRRSAVRNMERAGIPRNVAMEISGHRTESVYRRYDIVTSRDLRMAATKLEAYLNAAPVVTNLVTVPKEVQ